VDEGTDRLNEERHAQESTEINPFESFDELWSPCDFVTYKSYDDLRSQCYSALNKCM
jgi:hypothetical protein